MTNNLGLYVHIPFCDARCHYCDFIALCPKPGEVDQYLEALNEELLSFEKILYERDIVTIYIGGGTPSSLSLEQTRRLLHMLKPCSDKVREYTIEANPESVTPEKVDLWADYGINRVSLGVQTSDGDWLKTLGRIHSAKRVQEAVEEIRKRIHSINLDLIYALAPGDETYLKSLEDIIDLKPQHISIYELEVYDHLPLAKMIQGRVDSDESYEQFHRLRETLEHGGYERYEVSNFALPGFEAVHNQRYWTRDDTLGIGLGAHSLINNQRFNNTSDLGEYLAGNRQENFENLTEIDQLSEEFMLGLRRVKGMNYRNLLGKYPSHQSLIQRYVDRQVELGRLEIINDELRPTILGLDLLDRVVLDFLSLF